MNSQHLNIEPHRRRHRPGHRVRYVVKFEVQENFSSPFAGNFFDYLRATGREKFKTDFEDPDIFAKTFHYVKGVIVAGHIKGKYYSFTCGHN